MGWEELMNGEMHHCSEVNRRILIIAVAFLLALMGFRAPFPLPAVAIAAVIAFVLALAGGYVGEVAHNLRFRSAWGDEEPGTYREVPKPGA